MANFKVKWFENQNNHFQLPLKSIAVRFQVWAHVVVFTGADLEKRTLTKSYSIHKLSTIEYQSIS